MQEPAFIKRNLKKWKRFEQISLDSQPADGVEPDELAAGFIEVTDDLSYARTFYPESNTTRYLNELAARMHSRIYRNKKAKPGRLSSFWRFELPLTFYEAYRPMLVALIVFFLGVGIGVLSTSENPDFARALLGDEYVDRTLDDIESGEVLAMYGHGSGLDVFLGVTLNNIQVALLSFASGMLLGLGTLGLLLFNGILIGTFHTLLARYGQLEASLYTVYLHGTLEIFSLVIAGGAGFMLAGALLFPGTHTRVRSLMTTARKAVKIVIGLLPLFLIAGLLEGFVTRYGDGSLPGGFLLNAVIILLSLGFLLFYFGLYPVMVHRRMQNGGILRTKTGWKIVPVT